MKILKPLFTIVITLAIYSCKKSDVTLQPTIVGKWNLVSDSTYSFLAAGGTPTPTSHKYTGTPADYYNFTSTGKVYINNNGRIGLDTANYQFTSANMVKIYYQFPTYQQPYVINGVFTITTLTAHSLIMSSTGLTPEGSVSTFLTISR